jgi:hypothetical protein
MDMKSVQKDGVLRKISSQDFLTLGTGHIAYIKQVQVMNQTAYALHAADGTALTLTDSSESAFALAMQNDLDPVTLQ